MEWFHRLCGNVLGGVFGVGFAGFLLGGYFTRKMKVRLSLFLLLGGLQGVIGWWMVKSGIHKKPEYLSNPAVSTYRLITHNGMAMMLYGSILYHSLILLKKRHFQQTILDRLKMVKRSF